MMALLMGVALIGTLARRLRLPYPSLLVLGGLLLALVPGLPQVRLSPDLVLLVFLPPLLYSAGQQTSWRDFRANVRPIGLLAVGLVLVTTVGVAAGARAIVPSLPWGAALVLGAIVSPTDAIAVTAVAQHLRLPRRIITILEGESLANDATGLVVYRFAVAAVVTGQFSVGRAAVGFALVSAGGALLGLAIGYVSRQLQSLVDDPPVEIALQLLTGYAAWLPAERLGVSGVFAAAAAGLYTGYFGSTVMGSRTRLQARGFWSTLDYLLNGVLFLLLGLQVRVVLQAPPAHPAGRLALACGVVSVATIALRVLWVFPATYLPRLLSRRLRERDPSPPVRAVAVIAWAGIRGVLSLVTALAVPLTVADGTPYPERELTLLLAFAVIVTTLVAQGLTLPWVIARLGIADDGAAAREERHARVAAAQAARARLDEMMAKLDAPRAAVGVPLREQYDRRLRGLESEVSGGAAGQDMLAERDRQVLYVHLRRELISVEREVLISLRAQGVIGDATLHRVEHELDLAEERL